MVGGQNKNLSNEGKAQVDAILKRALVERQFRNNLLSNPEEALEYAELEPVAVALLSRMQRSEIEEQGIYVRPYRIVLMEDGRKFSNISG